MRSGPERNPPTVLPEPLIKRQLQAGKRLPRRSLPKMRPTDNVCVAKESPLNGRSADKADSPSPYSVETHCPYKLRSSHHPSAMNRIDYTMIAGGKSVAKGAKLQNKIRASQSDVRTVRFRMYLDVRDQHGCDQCQNHHND